ncbi:MAG: Usg family protein [Rhodospirillales bacterium]
MHLAEPRLLSYRLTLAEITYHLPDYPELLQNFIWQDFDTAPAFPVLTRFLDYWQRNLEGRLHSVTVTVANVCGPTEYRYARGLLTLH